MQEQEVLLDRVDYNNSNIVPNFFNNKSELNTELKKFPYLDTNDPYYASFVENFQEDKLKKNTKPLVEIIIEHNDRANKKIDS